MIHGDDFESGRMASQPREREELQELLKIAKHVLFGILLQYVGKIKLIGHLLPSY
jgi:hypothetical protein